MNMALKQLGVPPLELAAADDEDWTGLAEHAARGNLRDFARSLASVLMKCLPDLYFSRF